MLHLNDHAQGRGGEERHRQTKTKRGREAKTTVVDIEYVFNKFQLFSHFAFSDYHILYQVRNIAGLGYNVIAECHCVAGFYPQISMNSSVLHEVTCFLVYGD